MEYKFRAWDGYKMYSPTIEGTADISEYLNEVEYLMQWTGLVDKNGKEAYEGDIYTCGYKRSDGTHKYGDYNLIEDIRDFDTEDEFEIIGNKFANPELIKL